MVLRCEVVGGTYPLATMVAHRLHGTAVCSSWAQHMAPAGHCVGCELPAAVAEATCKLCAGGREDAAHVLFHCAPLAGVTGPMLVAVRGVLQHPEVRRLATGPVAGDVEVVLLALILGGDLSHRPGLEGFDAPARKSPDMSAGRDRLSALRVSSGPLVHAFKLRLRLLRTRGLIPASWAAGPYPEYQPPPDPPR